jgi:hypothetical protein
MAKISLHTQQRPSKHMHNTGRVSLRPWRLINKVNLTVAIEIFIVANKPIITLKVIHTFKSQFGFFSGTNI